MDLERLGFDPDVLFSNAYLDSMNFGLLARYHPLTLIFLAQQRSDSYNTFIVTNLRLVEYGTDFGKAV